MAKRHARKTEFAAVQRLIRVNPGRAARQCIAGTWGRSKSSVDPAEMHRFWKDVFERESEVGAERLENTKVSWQLVRPITSQDVEREKALLRNGTPGVDGISLRLVRSIPNGCLSKMFNLWLLAGYLPLCLKRHRTVLIPKADDPKSASEFRPITISSFLVRLHHKIIAKQCSSAFELHPAQHAIRKGDGCAENVTLLDTILRDATQNLQPLRLAVLDVSKAFDSVNHGTVLNAAARMGAPPPLLCYIAQSYDGCVTYFDCCHDLPISMT